jgi:integrase
VEGRAEVKAPTVLEWSERWQRLYPGHRSAETRRHNDQMCGPFVRKHGSKPLDGVTQLLAQEWAVKHPGQVKFLRLMFAKAVKAEVLSRNVWEHVELPKRTKPKRRPPTPEELERLVDAARRRYDDHVADLILVVAYSGVRLSEVAALRCRDVALPGRLTIWDEKKDRSWVIAVFEPGRDALARAVRRRWWSPRDLDRLVWVSPQRCQFTRASLGRLYRNVCDEAGVTGTTLHSLRHYCATWLLDQGADDRDVAIQLGHVDEAGHANTDHVRNTYGHPTVEPALARLEALTQEGSHDGYPRGEGPRPAGTGRAPDDGVEGGGLVRGHLRRVGPDESALHTDPEAARAASEPGGNGA